MKRIVCICFSLLFFAACSNNTAPTPPCEDCEPSECNPDEEDCGGPGPQPPDPPQPPSGTGLSVQGRQLMKNGQPIVLRGMSLYWYTGPWGGGQPGNEYYNENTVRILASDTWGSNVVRAAIGSVHEEPSDALAIAKKMMDWARTHNIYVIIDNHSHNAHRSGPSASANNFFREVSKYVKDKGYTHVIYEIYNEPICDDDQANPSGTFANSCTRTIWAKIKSYAQGVISTIRNNDPDGVIIVGTPNYSSYLTNGGLPTDAGPMDDPIAGKNIMYGFHFYAGSHTTTYRTRVKQAYCRDFPIFISEWGTVNSDGNGSVNTAESNNWASLMEGAGISWANWCLLTGISSGALSSKDVAGGTSASGTLVKNYIKRIGVTPEQISCN